MIKKEKKKIEKRGKPSNHAPKAVSYFENLLEFVIK
jgi:hypothetical protein